MQPTAQSFGAGLVRPPYRASAEQFSEFVRGVEAVLNQWTALHLVAHHCDPHSLPNLFHSVTAWFEQVGEVYSDELEDFFTEFFESVRSVIIEDDSMKEISDVLHDMYCRCCQNDYSLVSKYQQSLGVYRQMNPVAMSVNGDGEADEDGNVEYLDEGALENGEEMADANEEAPIPSTKPKRRKKNAYAMSSDGWNTIV